MSYIKRIEDNLDLLIVFADDLLKTKKGKNSVKQEILEIFSKMN